MEKAKSKKFLSLCQKYGVDHNLVPEVLSFEGACKVLELKPGNLPLVGRLPKRHQKRILADYKLTIIADAMKKIAGEEVDYNDTSKGKYHPVFRVQADAKRPSGFGLSYGDCDRWDSGSRVGVRLSFPNSDMAEFFGKHFLKLHIDHHLMT